MSKRVSDEQLIEDYFANCPEATAVTMAEKVRLILKIRKIIPNALDNKPKVGRPRKTQQVKLKEPEPKSNA